MHRADVAALAVLAALALMCGAMWLSLHAAASCAPDAVECPSGLEPRLVSGLCECVMYAHARERGRKRGTVASPGGAP